MKKIVVLILACIVLSLTAFADKKPKKSNEDGQGADITTVVLPPTDKDILDSLQQSADSLLKLLGNRKELVIPNLDMFMVWLMNSDTVDSDHDIMIRFGEMVIDDIRFLRLQNDNDSVYRQFVSYHEASKMISNIQQILSCSYDENKIGCLEHQLGKLEKSHQRRSHSLGSSLRPSRLGFSHDKIIPLRWYPYPLSCGRRCANCS